MVEMNSGGNFAKQGAEYKTKGDKIKTGSFFGNIFGSKEQRNDDAKELYLKAANCFKLAEDKYSAAEMYLKCADMEDNMAFKAGHLKEAGN